VFIFSIINAADLIIGLAAFCTLGNWDIEINTKCLFIVYTFINFVTTAANFGLKTDAYALSNSGQNTMIYWSSNYCTYDQNL